MSVYFVRVLGFSSALLATFLGGFLFVSAVTADINIAVVGQGAVTSPISVSAEEDVDFYIELTGINGGIGAVDIFLEDGEGNLVENFSSVSCFDGAVNDSPDSSEVFCTWDSVFEGTTHIEFTTRIDAEGDYTLLVYVIGSSPDDEDLYEYTVSVEAGGSGESFTFDAAETQDVNTNGYIDAFKLTFSSEVNIDTVNAGDIAITGYVVTGWSTWEGEARSLRVEVDELVSPDTDTYGVEVAAVGISGANGTELVSETLVNSTDAAGPAMVSGTIAEDINEATLNKSSLNDFSLSENSITSIDEIGAGVVALTLGGAAGAADINVTVGAEDIKDPRGNGTAEHTITATKAPDTTPIVINSVGLTTSATSTSEVMVGDTITLTFSLAEVAGTASVSILNEDAIAPSVDGTTYTATYIVDADTAPGTVTFAIAVEDAAGNETAVSATTDASSLKVIAAEEEVGGSEGSSTIAFSIDLTAGRNLISLPVEVANTDITEVLSGISGSITAVWAYIGSEWSVYRPGNAALSNLTEMHVGHAYFIDTTSAVTLSGEGQVWSGERTLSSGWSLVGYALPDASTIDAVSIDTAFSSVGLAGVAYTDLLQYVSGLYVAATEVDPGAGFFMNISTGPKTLKVPAELN